MILSETLRSFVASLNWTNQNMALLVDVHRFLFQLFLQPHPNLKMVNLAGVQAHRPHPIPRNTGEEGRVILWADELGKLLVVHDQCIAGGKFFIGIACERAFAGQGLNTYSDKDEFQRAFPLVGPEQIGSLDDCYDWEIPTSAHDIKLGFEHVKRNFSAIGATGFESPSSGGSHYKVKFPNGKSWPCDKNWGSCIGDNVLKQLKEYCTYPLPVIKMALSSGSLPNRKYRLDS